MQHPHVLFKPKRFDFILNKVQDSYSKETSFKHFKHKVETSACKNLSDENGALCRDVPAFSIQEANLGVLAATGKCEGKHSST